ncbi:MAG: hypothetical protein IT440_14390 [Phycisphaeraceae bacterium]|nr:hypothetical protein [Phycisphaeraceae bacterium]
MSITEQGHRVWYFPDGDIPPVGPGELHAHESLVMLNPNDREASVTITVYYEDKSAKVLTPITVGAQRVRCIRTNDPISGYQITMGQYALKLESSVGLICQIGRMDTRQANLAYYTVMGVPG